jgi:hypothetical protein
MNLTRFYMHNCGGDLYNFSNIYIFFILKILINVLYNM